MNTRERFFHSAKHVVLILMLVLSGVAGASGTESSKRDAKVAAGKGEQLTCRVEGVSSKIITMTNNTDQVLAKGTKVNFDDSTGLSMTRFLRADLEPGDTVVIHAGPFIGRNCKLRVIQ